MFIESIIKIYSSNFLQRNTLRITRGRIGCLSHVNCILEILTNNTPATSYPKPKMLISCVVYYHQIIPRSYLPKAYMVCIHTSSNSRLTYTLGRKFNKISNEVCEKIEFTSFSIFTNGFTNGLRWMADTDMFGYG